MFITQCYKYKYNGIVYVGGQVPAGAEILETMNILIAEEDYNLIRKNDSINVGNSVWLVDEDNQDNYIEIKESKDDNSK